MALTTWVIVGLRFGTLGFHPYSFYAENYYTQLDDELFEFLIAFSFFSFAVLNYRLRGRIYEYFLTQFADQKAH